jgi:hypothetical protein
MGRFQGKCVVKLEGFEEFVVEAAPKRPAPARLNVAVALERRLENWRTTVREPKGETEGVCAFWAAAYIKARNDHQRRLALELELIQPENKLSRVPEDELDGWLVEAAVRGMIHHDQKQLLRFRYVFDYPDHWIRTKLKIRVSQYKIIHAKALQNLLYLLDNAPAPAKIRPTICMPVIRAHWLMPALDGQDAPVENYSDEFKRLTDGENANEA